jgi:hypothetical protein
MEKMRELPITSKNQLKRTEIIEPGLRYELPAE